MYKQYSLPYCFNDLEPYIDTKTMEIHYQRHHKIYTANLNNMAEKAGIDYLDITTLLSSLDRIKDKTVKTALRNNGGGYYNHNLYFSIIGPHSEYKPTGKLGAKINETFGSFDSMKNRLSDVALGQFGSGWAWLSVAADGSLVISSSSNQDNPISLQAGTIPIFTIDVWEHAYYLRYKNLRADYIKNFFEVVNWKAVERLYEKALMDIFKKSFSSCSVEECGSIPQISIA